ncbi:hypothetical protein Z043_111699 [Scleropages formosus]|uniref:Ig-like domain-containing protein n=1 Tax=Scleropages formosus TaxID=113540 RepID=A0A0P7WZ95_SCLFO|nr:hypothetical protein Z043_111699 [Scleropages formosus]
MSSLYFPVCITTFAVILRTTNKSPWANEFEWDLENRAYIKEPATLVITNLTRSDTAQYRCEVTAHMDHKTFDEVLIDLVVRVKPVVPRCSVPKAVPVGQPAELRCTEDEAFPRPQYQWFHNQEEMAQDPKSNPKFSNSSYTINRETGTLVSTRKRRIDRYGGLELWLEWGLDSEVKESALGLRVSHSSYVFFTKLFTGLRKEDSGQYHCMAENDAGYAECTPQTLEVYDVNVVGIVLGMLALAGVVMVIMVGICCACKNGYFVRSREAGSNYKAPDSRDGLDYIKPEDEGGFRHKSSFVI